MLRPTTPVPSRVARLRRIHRGGLRSAFIQPDTCQQSPDCALIVNNGLAAIGCHLKTPPRMASTLRHLIVDLPVEIALAFEPIEG